jgi:hypothetical protein
MKSPEELLVNSMFCPKQVLVVLVQARPGLTAISCVVFDRHRFMSRLIVYSPSIKMARFSEESHQSPAERR